MTTVDLDVIAGFIHVQRWRRRSRAAWPPPSPTSRSGAPFSAGQTEHCLLGVTGSPKVAGKNSSTLLSAQRRRHSEKPEEFYTFAMAYSPGPYLELFARRFRTDWHTWGNEVSVAA